MCLFCSSGWSGTYDTPASVSGVAGNSVTGSEEELLKAITVENGGTGFC